MKQNEKIIREDRKRKQEQEEEEMKNKKRKVIEMKDGEIVEEKEISEEPK